MCRAYSSRASVRKPAYRSGRPAPQSGTRTSSEAMTYPAAGIQASAATNDRDPPARSAVVRPRVPPRLSAHRSRLGRAERSGNAAGDSGGASPQPFDCQLPIAKPMPAPAAPASRMTAILDPRPPPAAPESGDADRRAEPGAHADPVPRTHAGTVTAGAACPLWGAGDSDKLPLSRVLHSSQRSGPARRMESLLAHIARKERDRVRVSKVDVDDRPDLAERFCASRCLRLHSSSSSVVSRIEGRATAPKIESMLDPHLAGREAA